MREALDSSLRAARSSGRIGLIALGVVFSIGMTLHDESAGLVLTLLKATVPFLLYALVAFPSWSWLDWLAFHGSPSPAYASLYSATTVQVFLGYSAAVGSLFLSLGAWPLAAFIFVLVLNRAILLTSRYQEQTFSAALRDVPEEFPRIERLLRSFADSHSPLVITLRAAGFTLGGSALGSLIVWIGNEHVVDEPIRGLHPFDPLPYVWLVVLIGCYVYFTNRLAKCTETSDKGESVPGKVE